MVKNQSREKVRAIFTIQNLKYHLKVIKTVKTYIFDSELVWRMQIMVIKGKIIVFCV